jgi:ketosteroid isomerase-like protein
MLSVRLALLTAVVGVSACSPGNSSVSDADLAEIRAKKSEFVAAVLSGDKDAATRMYADMAIIMPANEQLYRGRMAYRESMENMPEVAGFEISNAEFTPLGEDAVVVTGTYMISTMEPGAALAIGDIGKYLEIWRRGEDGWAVSWDIWNSSQSIPMPTMPDTTR